MITVRLAIPDAFVPRAAYAFRALALRWDLPVRFGNGKEPVDVVYGSTDGADIPPTVFLRFHPDSFAADAPGYGRFDGQRWTWSAGASSEPDLIGGTFRLLTFADERQVGDADRDRRGVFLTSALSPARGAIAQNPVVEHHASTILECLLAARPRLAEARLPRWPDGKHYALVLTHDVDHLHLGALPELLTNALKFALRREQVYFRLWLRGLSYIGRLSRNPFFAFREWQAWEAARGFRSAFYLFVRPRGVPADINDCKSSVASRRVDWAALRQLAAEGWEFGLHPSIHVKQTNGAFEAARVWLERNLDAPIDGIRHHYWAIDWRRPYLTYRQHIAAGFLYDSSIAWREAPGFRAATCLPFLPFDLDADRELAIQVLPCCLMDGHVLYANTAGQLRDRDAAIADGRRILSTVRAHGGAAVVNWHSETAFNRLPYDGFVDALDGILAPALADGDAWLATPRELVDHWRRRAQAILPSIPGS